MAAVASLRAWACCSTWPRCRYSASALKKASAGSL
jgi:hypothetical protein